VAARLAAHEYREKKRSRYRKRRARRPRTTKTPHEPTARYHIAEEAAEKTDITVWLRKHMDDPATKVKSTDLFHLSINFACTELV
jgi:hypothetical protein